MVKVYFKECSYNYDNGCSCCESVEVVEYWFSHTEGDVSYVQEQRLEDLGGCNEQYHCLVDVSYILTETSLTYHEYVDWCYSLFGFEDVDKLLLEDGVEVVFIDET